MKLDLYAEHAKEKFGFPPDWQVFQYECKPSGADTYLFMQLTGIVAPVKNGKTVWRKGDKTTKATVTLTFKEHDAWKLDWEKRTGLCFECTGTSQVMESWSERDGIKYRPCPRCQKK